MKNLKHIIMLIALLCPGYAMAEGTDEAGLWISADIEKKLTKKWSVEAEGEFRMKENVSVVDRMSIGISTSYKFSKWLKADAGYEYLHTRNGGGETESGKYYNSTVWYPRHRLHVSLTESVKACRLKLSLRERWVYTYMPSYDRNRMDLRKTSDSYGTVSSKTKPCKTENVLRMKLSGEYNIPKCKFTPFASAEMYLPMNSEICFGKAQKFRYSLGTEYKINKRQSAKIYYLFQDRTHITDDDDVTDSHIIGAGYSYSF